MLRTRKHFLTWLATAIVATAGITYTAEQSINPSTTTTVLTGSIGPQTDHAWVCNSAVDLTSVDITIDSASTVPYAIHLDNGCTGTIGTINCTNAKGDCIDVSGAASDVTVNGGTLNCTAYNPGAHQDGIQAWTGDNVTFNNMTVNCTSANHSDFFVNDTSTDNKPAPNAITFNNGCMGSTQSSTAVVSDNQTNSGVSNSMLYKSKYFTYQKQQTAIDSNNMYPGVIGNC